MAEHDPREPIPVTGAEQEASFAEAALFSNKVIVNLSSVGFARMSFLEISPSGTVAHRASVLLTKDDLLSLRDLINRIVEDQNPEGHG